MKQSALLKRILAHKRGEFAVARKALPLQQLKERLAKAPPTRGFRDAITRRRPYEIHLIGELKKASPVAGVLRSKLDVPALAGELESSGVSALSVLTDARFFQGDPESVHAAKKSCGLPVLRKDFIVDEYQIYESRLLGADAVLLITRLLAQKKLKEFISLARNLSMASVVEVHSAAEVRRALNAGADTIGVNTRDLGSFKTDFRVAEELRARIPAGTVVICESGVSDQRQIERLRDLRYDAVLIGEALMRARHLRAFIHELLHT